MEMDNGTVIEVKGLSFEYSGLPVLRGVGFCVAQGDFVAVIGANGAGKSTLLRLLLGELLPLEGAITLFGQDIRRFHRWPLIGYVPQNGIAAVSRFPATALEVVCANLYAQTGFLRPVGKKGKALARQALAQVGMADYQSRLIGELSGGQLQRVLLARVLVAGCKLLVLDEPTTGVDAQGCQELYDLLRRLNREQGLTVVMVTHDMARCAPYVSRSFCVEEGTLVELSREQMHHELHHRHKHP